MAAKKKPTKSPDPKDKIRKEYDAAVNAIAEYGMRGLETPRGDSRAMYKKFAAKKGPVTKADVDKVVAYLGKMQDLRRGRKK